MLNPCVVSLNIKDARHVSEKTNYADIPSVRWDFSTMKFTRNTANENKNYPVFIAELKSLMKICDDDIKIVYLDYEGDEIPIESDIELDEALRYGYAINLRNGDCIDVIIKKSDKTDSKLEKFEVVVVKEKPKCKNMCSDSKMPLTMIMVDEVTDSAASDLRSYHPSLDELKSSRSVDSGKIGCDGKIPQSSVSTATNNKLDKHKHDMKEIKEKLMKTMNKNIEDVEDNFSEIHHIQQKHVFAEYNEKEPRWFKNSLEQFKAEILLEVEALLDERLRTSKSPETKSDDFIEGVGKPFGSPTITCNHKNRKLMEKLNKICEREKRLDQQLEKMESKKIKMWEKMSGAHLKSAPVQKGFNEFLVDKNGETGFILPENNPLHVTPHEKFTIVWKIKNTCSFPWTKKTEMKLFEITDGLKPYVTKLKCPELQPLSSGTVCVEFRAPRFEGSYITKWLLYHCDKQFGPWVMAKVNVKKHLKKLKSKRDDEVVESNITQKLCQCSLEDKDIDSDEKPNNLNSLKQTDISKYAMESIFNDTDEEKTDEDAFVVVPMPPCFFPDAPEDAVDPVPLKIKRKSVVFKDEKAKPENQKPLVIDEASVVNSGKINFDESNGAIGCGDSPDEPYHSIEGSIYVVDKAGKCILMNDAGNESAENLIIKENNQTCDNGKSNNAAENNNVSEHCVIRDKIKKCVYIDSNGHPFDLPADKAEKIYPSDPEYYNTMYTVCDGVSVDSNGILGPINGNNFSTFFCGYGTPQTPAGVHPEFGAPIHFASIPPPPPAPPAPTLLFPPHPPPPQLYQSFLPPSLPPPPAHPHNLAGHPPPFHIQSGSILQPSYYSHQGADPFNNLTHFEYMPPHPVNLTVDKTDICQAFGPNLNENKPKEGYKKDVMSKNVTFSTISGSNDKNKSVKKLTNSASFCAVIKDPSVGRKPKTVSKKFKLSDSETSSERKKSSKSNDVVSKKRGIYLLDSSPKKTTVKLYPKISSDLPEPPTEETIDFFDPAAAPPRSEVNKLPNPLIEEIPPETKTADDTTKQGAPVHILPEVLMTGAINAACSAFSSAVSAFNSFRPKEEESQESQIPEKPKELIGDAYVDDCLRKLYDMGFTDTIKNARLLARYCYQFDKVLDHYMNHKR